MIVDLHRIVRIDVLGEPVPDRLGLGGEAAEHPVPDDEDAAVVPIEVGLVRPVVDAMVGRSVEQELDRTRQRTDPLGVDRELVQQPDALQHEDHPHRQSEQSRWHPSHSAQDIRHRMHPGQPDRGGQIEVLAGVVHAVRGPQQPDPMVGAMRPVVAEIGHHQAEHPDPPRVRGQVQRGARGGPDHGRERNQVLRQRFGEPADREGRHVGCGVAAGSGVARAIGIAAVGEPLHEHEQRESGDGIAQQLHSAHEISLTPPAVIPTLRAMACANIAPSRDSASLARGTRRHPPTGRVVAGSARPGRAELARIDSSDDAKAVANQWT